MRKRAWVLAFILLILMIGLVFSADELTESEQIDNAYQCLEDKTVEKCSDLSDEEKAFTLLAIDECQSELLESSANEECWPAGKCNLKTTAQAVLALDNTNADVEKPKKWLISQNTTPTEIQWFLEIDTNELSTCRISYSGLDYNVDVFENKKLSNNAGTCLSLAQDDYWLRVSPSCYGTEFEISCDKSFLTTLLFKKTDSSTVHVLDKTSSASAEGSTFEKVKSFCFGNTQCDYEGSLWAALVLDSLGEDVSAFMPYLIVMSPEYPRLIPETFLYYLTDNIDYRSKVLLGQKQGKYWMESGDKYYDTALALYPFQQETPEEKQNSKDWLLDVQDEEGCWQENIRNTAFILVSLWPREFGGGDNGDNGLIDCEDAGYYCMSSSACEGEILNEYSCPSLYKCCSQPKHEETCSELNGEICSSNQICKNGNEMSTPDTAYGEVCCVGGYCETPAFDLTECEEKGGTCRSTCEDDEKKADYNCNTGICCIYSSGSGDSGTGSYWWIWVLLLLIILIVVGIIFRDKLRALWLKIKSKFGKGKGSSGPNSRGPRRPPPFHRPLPKRTISRRNIPSHPERRILLPKKQPNPGPKPTLGKRIGKSRTQKELDDVLKKLKDMGK